MFFNKYGACQWGFKWVNMDSNHLGTNSSTAWSVWTVSGWWFQELFIFHNIWDNPSHWLIFFKMVKTPKQVCVDSHLQIILQLRGRFMLLAEEIQCDFMSNSVRRTSSRFSLLLTQPAQFQGWIALTSETWMGESTESKFGPIIRGTFGPLKLD